MSLEAFIWAVVRAPDVPAHCLGVLQGLANHASPDGRDAFPAIERLAYYARKSDRAVQRDLIELEKLGLIRRGDQRAAFRIPERYRPTVWDLALERERAAFTPARSRDSQSSTDDALRGDADVTPVIPRGDVHGQPGVTPTSPEPVPVTGPTTEGGELTSPRGPAAKKPPSSSRSRATAPAGRCPVHAVLPPESPVPACHPCKVARVELDGWLDDRAAERRVQEAAGRAAARAARAAAAAEVQACRLCDDGGRMLHPLTLVCTHDQAANSSAITARGAAMAQARAIGSKNEAAAQARKSA